MNDNSFNFSKRDLFFKAGNWPVALLLALIYLGFFGSCNKEDDESSSGYDPALPVTVSTFMPDSGYIRSDFVVTGSNFGTDQNALKVLFSDNDREATIIGVDNTAIYCIVPRQQGGDNPVKVVRGEDTISVEGTFHYTVKQSVSTITGVVGENDPKDGTLAEARFGHLYGIAAVSNGDLLAVETSTSQVRYVAVNDNNATTLQTGFTGGTPARTRDRKTAYIIQRDAPHKIYRYSEKNLWEPELFAPGIAGFNGQIGSCALDGRTDEWLYFFDTNGKFGRLEIAHPNTVEVLNERVEEVRGNWESQIAYSAYDDCLFFSSFPKDAVYKVSKDGQDIELFIGGNGAGNVFGDRLTTAKLNNPAGMIIDEFGDIYVANVDGYTISKCDRKSGWVSLAAGIPGQGWLLHEDGDPLEAKLHLPYGLSDDEDGNFIICECYQGGTIRKLAIE